VQVVAFCESAAIDPHDLIADLKASVFDRDRESVIGTRPAEREQVPTRLQDSEAFTEHVHAGG
jgi:hypothetical protein